MKLEIEMEKVVCSRCSSFVTQWNDANYLICMNCGKILVEPLKKSEIVHGIVTWATTVKERLWKRRVADGEVK